MLNSWRHQDSGRAANHAAISHYAYGLRPHHAGPMSPHPASAIALSDSVNVSLSDPLSPGRPPHDILIIIYHNYVRNIICVRVRAEL